VGLKSDSTVVAVGHDLWGNCNVDGWTNIIQVTAGTDHTVVLKSDGTAIAVGDTTGSAMWAIGRTSPKPRGRQDGDVEVHNIIEDGIAHSPVLLPNNSDFYYAIPWLTGKKLRSRLKWRESERQTYARQDIHPYVRAVVGQVNCVLLPWSQ
jgi:hypothetical protein